MTTIISDEAAKLAAIAWPIYRALGWHWRDHPVTEARLALGIRDGIQHLLDHPEQDSHGTGGLCFYWEDEGEDRHIAITVSVDIGTLRPGDSADLNRWPNTSGNAVAAR